ncbi:MAG TPA: hypothetical protein DCL73_09830, partial [Treponema sp.]|nr:hypothetical protein [Treponema sp.]
MRVTIKLILNAAAALLLLHAASGGYAASVPVTTGYYIRKDVKKADGTTEKNVCCSIALSVDKVQYTLTVPENSYSGYTAAYEDGNGNWQILKETDGQTEWKSVTDTSKKEKLAKLFAPVQNQNMEISAADGTAAELTSPGYIVQSESPALAAEVSGQAYKGIVLPSLSGGRFYLAEYGTGTTYLLTFRTAGSFMDLEAEALSKGRTRQQILNNMFSWLAAADKDKESSTDSVLSEKLAEMLAESLVKDDAFDGLYTTGGNEYIRGYVEKAFTNGRNIYADRLHNSDAQYNPKGYKAIDADESGKLADKAVEINSLKRGSRKKYETSAGGRAFIADCIAQ